MIVNLGDGWTLKRLSDGSVKIEKKLAVAPGVKAGFSFDRVLTSAQWDEAVRALSPAKGPDENEVQQPQAGQAQAEAPTVAPRLAGVGHQQLDVDVDDDN